MNYRGYTIEPETDPWEIKFGSRYRIGSAEDRKTFLTLHDAKSFIDEEIMKSYPDWKVETIVNLKDATGKTSGYKLRNITKFTWLSEAVPFAVRHNGELTTTFNCP